MNKVYCFDTFNGAEDVVFFQNLEEYKYKDYVSGNGVVKVSEAKDQQGAFMHVFEYLNACYEFDSAESVTQIKSMFEADKQKLVDFVASSPENGWFLFFTIEGSDLNLMYVSDLELAKKVFDF